MSTVRFSQVTFATKSWVAEAWEKMVVELFSGATYYIVFSSLKSYAYKQKCIGALFGRTMHFIYHIIFSKVIP